MKNQQIQVKSSDREVLPSVYISEFKETLLDFLHLAGMAISNGRHMPSTMFLDRESYHLWCERQELKKIRTFQQEIKKQKLLNITEKDNRVIIELSDKGKIQTIKQQILSRKKYLPENMVCLVSYDIPELASKSRKVFRDFLKQAGFQQHHKSVWKSDYDVVELLKSLVHLLDLSEWVSVYQARTIV